MRSHALLDFARAARTVLTRRPLRGPLHPDWPFAFELLVEGLKESRRRIQRLPITVQRRAWEAMQLPSAARPHLAVEDAHAAPVPSLWCAPKARRDAGPVLLYLHGGAYSFGSFGTHGDLIGRIALASGARALIPDFRLAPEHPFPAALDDAMASYRWLLEREDPARIVVGGDSAGGGLTVSLLVRARDEGLPLPAGGVLVCPWVDLSARGEPCETDWVDEEWGRGFGAGYLGDHDERHPLASPTFADLRGLPPLLVQAGDAEILFPQIQRFVARAREAGVEVEFDVARGMIHDWHMLAGLHAPSRHAIEDVARFVRKAALASPRRLHEPRINDRGNAHGSR